MKPHSPLTLADIEPALRDPGFTSDQTILLIDLPLLGDHECRAVPIETALLYLREVANLMSMPPEQIATWRRDLDLAIEAGLTPVIRVWAVDDRACLVIEGLRIAPVAQA